MVLGLVLGFAAYGVAVATMVISESNERMAAQAAAYEGELERLRRRNAELEKALEEERESFFYGGVVAASVAALGVVGPAVVEAVKEMR